MPPTTPMTAGRFYICDFITDTADADNQDLNGKTVGLNYFYVTDPASLRGDDYGDINKQLFVGGTSGIFTRWDGREDVQRFDGEIASRTELGYIKRYLANRQGNTDDPDYLFVMHGANDFEPFYDQDDNAKEYAKGFLRGYTKEWMSDNHERYIVHLEFHIVW